MAFGGVGFAGHGLTLAAVDDVEVAVAASGARTKKCGRQGDEAPAVAA